MKKYIILYLICLILINLTVLTIKNNEIPEPNGKYLAGAYYTTSGGYTDGNVEEIYKSFYTNKDIEQYAKELRKENIKESWIISPFLALIPCLLIYLISIKRRKKTSTS